MNGPYTLSTTNVTEKVGTNKIGYYTLHNSSKTVKYVGRSDHDLRGRLLDHVNQYYSYFSFEYTSSAKAAFEGECNLYHYHINNPLDNKAHPDRPSGTNWKCPRCSIFG